MTQVDPLSMWNAGDAKETILRFVLGTTLKGSETYVPPLERIAVFDNDGTLWVEQPYYTQLRFALDRTRELAADHPEWQTDATLKAALDNDISSIAAQGMAGVAKIVAASHAGITTEELAQAVRDWIESARHPRFRRLYTELIFQPQLQLIRFLREHDYRTYIVSGGGVEFMRAWSQDVYGIPPEQVVGSSAKTVFEMRNGRGVLVQLPEIDLVDDGPGKPVGINKYVGRRPTIAVGNSDGDMEMLQYATTGDGPSLGVYIHHDDAEREYAYDRHAVCGGLDKGIEEAAKRNWLVVSMQNDWNQIFS
ncbi:MAG: HAD family hydrolase [Caldilineaceae bacterium]|jgi:phosphoglycolate phosphatase-like HAD superfamily hydrolase